MGIEFIKSPKTNRQLISIADLLKINRRQAISQTATEKGQKIKRA